MRKTQSLIFIPECPIFYSAVQSQSSEEMDFMTLQEKIKRNPILREKFKCEARILAGLDKKTRKKNRRKNRQSSFSEEESVDNTNDVDYGDDEEKSYLKNMTNIEILLDFNPNAVIKKGENPPSVKRIKYFLPKWELTEEELNSNVLKSFLKRKLISFVTEAQMNKEMQIIRAREQQEENILAQRIRNAQLDRDGNPHRDVSGLRPPGGVSISEINGPSRIVDDISGYPAQATAGDGGVIHFDINPNERLVASSEERELQSLMKQQVTGEQESSVDPVTGLADINFSTGEYKT